MGLFSFTKHEPVGVVGQIIPVSNLFTVFICDVLRDLVPFAFSLQFY